MSKKIGLYNINLWSELKDYFINSDVEFIEIDTLESPDIFDFVILYDYNGALQKNYINIHPSLLPAFDGENAIQNAFLSGVKVSGVTIFNNERIIAQYPVLIGIDTHIDDFENEIIEIKKKLLPVVIDSLINDRVFDFSDLFGHKCHKNCNSCGGCKK